MNATEQTRQDATETAPPQLDLLAGADGFLRIKDICKLTTVTRTTIWAWVKAGKFPAPIALSRTVSVWRKSDIRAWIADPLQAAKTN